MLNPKDWDENHIQRLPIGEFDWLEVKGRRALDLTIENVKESHVLDNLSKAISAFANSGGGVLVFGLANPHSHWKVDDDGIDLVVKSPSTREWLEDIIPHLVEFPLPSFNVYVIQRQDKNSQIKEGRGIFVVEIPDSDFAPHQARDKRYYVRVGGKSRPIGHRLVLDIFGRRKHPKIILEFYIECYGAVEPASFTLSKPKVEKKYRLVVTAKNVGRLYAKYMQALVWLPVDLLPERQQGVAQKKGDKYVTWTRMNTKRDVVKGGLYGPTEYGPSWFSPILPRLSYTWEWEITEEFNLQVMQDKEIKWKVHVDNAFPEEGVAKIANINFYDCQ